MKALQPADHQEHAASFCSPCVYFSKNLDPSLMPPLDTDRDACGLGFEPGDENCTEMRTNNCGMRKNAG